MISLLNLVLKKDFASC